MTFQFIGGFARVRDTTGEASVVARGQTALSRPICSGPGARRSFFAERRGLTPDQYLELEESSVPIPATLLIRLAVYQDQPIEWFYEGISQIPEDV